MSKVKEIWAILKRHGYSEKSFDKLEDMIAKARELEEIEYKELIKVHPALGEIGEPEFGGRLK
tara:strand:+ start:5380 stop:5568 length:189 start_codon:yes stop_codon:yes gene_type:complete